MCCCFLEPLEARCFQVSRVRRCRRKSSFPFAYSSLSATSAISIRAPFSSSERQGTRPHSPDASGQMEWDRSRAPLGGMYARGPSLSGSKAYWALMFGDECLSRGLVRGGENHARLGDRSCQSQFNVLTKARETAGRTARLRRCYAREPCDSWRAKETLRHQKPA